MPKRVLVLGIVLLSTLAFPLTITGASIALPDIRGALGADLTSTQWVVNGYNASFASFLVFTGSLADVLGRRRIYTWGLALYVVTGVASALAGDIVALNVFRVIGGIGAAAAVTGGSAILAATFEGPARVRAFGLQGTVIGIGLAFGPTISGLFVDTLGWHAVFAIPAVLVAVALVSVPVLPKVDAVPGRKVDWLGGILFTVALLVLISAFVEGPDFGFGSPLILGGFLSVILLGVAFTVVERRHGDPMFELGLLANRGFSTFALAAGAIVIVLIPLLVYLPSYLISVVGLDAGEAGVWLLMLTVPTVLLPTAGAALARRLPTAMVAAISVAVTGVGVLLLVTIGAHSTPLGLLVPLVLSGSGFGLSTGLLDGQAISSVTPEQSGTAAGMFNTARLASETVGIAVVGAMLAALTGNRLSGADYTSALHTVCIALAAFAALATAGVTVLARRTSTPT